MKKYLIIVALALISVAGVATASMSGASTYSISASSSSKEYVKHVPALYIESEFGTGRDNVAIYSDGSSYYVKCGRFIQVSSNPYSSYKNHNVSKYNYCAPSGDGYYFFNI